MLDFPILSKVENIMCGLCQLGNLKHASHKKVYSPYTIKPLELVNRLLPHAKEVPYKFYIKMMNTVLFLFNGVICIQAPNAPYEL